MAVVNKDGTRTRKGRIELEHVCIKLPKGYKQRIGRLAFHEDRTITAVIKRSIENNFIQEYGIDLREDDNDRD